VARIVIAEDQAHIRHVLTMWMERHGHEVFEAATGRIALELLERHPVDLLMTDINMPELDGLELARRAFDACPTLRRVFVVTSRCDQREILAQLSDPRVCVFPKPFSPSQLVRDVDAAVGPAAADHAPEVPTGRGAGGAP
jgi:two-component system, cell cycle response regulator CpdR